MAPDRDIRHLDMSTGVDTVKGLVKRVTSSASQMYLAKIVPGIQSIARRQNADPEGSAVKGKSKCRRCHQPVDTLD